MYEASRFPQFYITASTPCPYLAGQMERKVFTHLRGDDAVRLNNALTHAGFRRSQNIVYRPACEFCQACVSVRVVVGAFKKSRSLARVRSKNADLICEIRPAQATSEQYSLFRAYIGERHGNGGMAEMTVLDYAAMVEDSTIETHLVEYRLPPNEQAWMADARAGSLVAVALTDVLADGLSMIYSYYDPSHEGRSLGSFMILDHIERARMLGLPYVYLGYWVPDSPKMAYKLRFQPQQHLRPDGWEDYSG